jgi:hypothetical protein
VDQPELLKFAIQTLERLGKLVYYRDGGSDKHLRDIAGILKFSGDLVDRDYVSRFAKQLGVADTWQSVLSKIRPV